jgi:hypothetical protein
MGWSLLPSLSAVELLRNERVPRHKIIDYEDATSSCSRPALTEKFSPISREISQLAREGVR